MNGNELNNMAQHYKEEMMRLYRKSGTAPQNGPACMNSRGGGAVPHDMAGTPVQGIPDAMHMSVNGSAHTVPVSCDCRFPSADSIIGAPTPRSDNTQQVQQAEQTEHTQISTHTAMSAMPETHTADADGSRLMGIMLNSSADNGVYAMPSDADAEREILPDFDFPADIPAESGEAVPVSARHSPSMGWISITGDNGWGYLQFEVFTAGGSYPVPGAVVTVKKQLPGGTGLTRVLVANRSGLTSTIALPAPTYSWKQHFSDSYRPFSEYIVTVRARGYYTLTDINIPIFAGVKSVQPIDLIPLPENTHTPIQPRDTAGNGSVG